MSDSTVKDAVIGELNGLGEHNPLTCYVTIGNSDNKLTQGDWIEFCEEIENYCRASSVFDGRGHVHIVGYSSPESQYQNMIIGFDIPFTSGWEGAQLRRGLQGIGSRFQQDSIALVVSGGAELLACEPIG